MLKLNAKTGFTYRILKKSLDARKKPELFYTYSVAVEIEDTKNSEEAIVKRAASSSVLIYKEKEYRIPAHGNISLDRRPVIAGAGPAGLFCAYILAEAGFRPIVIERGSRQCHDSDCRHAWHYHENGSSKSSVNGCDKAWRCHMSGGRDNSGYIS